MRAIPWQRNNRHIQTLCFILFTIRRRIRVTFHPDISIIWFTNILSNKTLQKAPNYSLLIKSILGRYWECVPISWNSICLLCLFGSWSPISYIPCFSTISPYLTLKNIQNHSLLFPSLGLTTRDCYSFLPPVPKYVQFGGRLR